MLVLASGSSARKALLAGAGLRFEVSPAQIDERAVEATVAGDGGPSPELARKLAEAKALSVSANRAGDVVIGADQILLVEGEQFHKPVDLARARDQLARLAGRTHELHSGIAIARNETVLWSHISSAALTMRSTTSAERDEILALEGAPALGSVGAYRLEGPSIRLFERIEGDYFTILGLPLLPLLAALRQHAPDVLESSL